MVSLVKQVRILQERAEIDSEFDVEDRQTCRQWDELLKAAKIPKPRTRRMILGSHYPCYEEDEF